MKIYFMARFVTKHVNYDNPGFSIVHISKLDYTAFLPERLSALIPTSYV